MWFFACSVFFAASSVSKIRFFRKTQKGQVIHLPLSLSQHSQQFVIRKGRMGVGPVQNGLHIFRAVFDLLGK